MTTAARIQAFLQSPIDVFETVEHRHEIWRDDPFDVPTIHAEARERFRDLMATATSNAGTPGRIMLLRGETGSGKTHLLRAFRSMVHRERMGFVGYMQLTSTSRHYARYLLSNLIDSLDQPYDDTIDQRSGLVRISTALASRAFEPILATMLRDDENMEPDEVTDLVFTGADRLIAQKPFQFADIDLLRALLYLYRSNPPLRARVMKYLRCEPLSRHDGQMLGDLAPKDKEEDPERMIEMLGRVLAVMTDRPQSLVMCLDQFELTLDLDKNQLPFQRALSTITGLADRVPSSLFVISGLADSFGVLNSVLSRTLRDRLAQVSPVDLVAARTQDEALAIVRERLRHLYTTGGETLFDERLPLDPFPPDLVRRRPAWRTRDIIEACRVHRQQCKVAKALVAFSLLGVGTDAEETTAEQAIERWEREWNDFSSSEPVVVPDDEKAILELLAWGIRIAGEELESGHRFPTTVGVGGVKVDATVGGVCRERMFVALCNKPPNFGHLKNQISRFTKDVAKLTVGTVLVLVRLDDFPNTPTVSREIGAVVKAGGRSVAIQDADVRTILLLRSFFEKHEKEAKFDAWFRQENHISRLASIRRILRMDALERLEGPPPTAAVPPLQKLPVAEPPLTNAVASTGQEGHITLGVTRGLRAGPLTLSPAVLTRHAAFLGGTGSGKTTLALSVIEQLLLQGVPVIMLDRKGDLAGYARSELWQPRAEEPQRAANRAALAERVDVALFTPGRPDGRPLAIGVIPEGVTDLPLFDRNETVAQSAQALSDMLNYRTTGRDAALRAILIQALQVLTEVLDRPVTLDAVVELIAEQDPLLVSRVGRLDTKLFEQLVRDLETMHLTAAHLFGDGAERMDPDLLLGRGRFAKSGKTRLSIISTKFLRSEAETLFWVGHFLFAILRWGSKNPKDAIQAALLFDEADLYLPAMRQPITKAPMESLLKRGRSAGLSVFLATQSPGDLDYRCRDNVRTWFLGRIREPTALQKLRPMAEEVVDKLAGQSPGEFYMVDEKERRAFQAHRSLLATDQIPEDEMLRLAETADRGDRL